MLKNFYSVKPYSQNPQGKPQRQEEGRGEINQPHSNNHELR